MARLNPDKLHVKWLDETTPTTPASPRHYTLTHSDSTGDLFLTSGVESPQSSRFEQFKDSTG